MHAFRLIALASAAAASGCANLDSIYRPLSLEGNAVAVDAKQRGIYSVQRDNDAIVPAPATGQEPTPSLRGEVAGSPAASPTVGTHPVICPEPSPDALSAYAASGGLTGLLKSATGKGDPGAQVQGAFALGETAGSIGLRTQSIQLLRDGLFSNCLAYMNQAVNGEQFFQLQRRSQNFTLGLLAIEQLTGAVKADQVALSTSSGASTGSDDVSKQQDAVTAAEKALSASKEALEKARAEHRLAEQDAKASAGVLAEAEKKLKAAPTTTSDADRNALQTAVEEATVDARTQETNLVNKRAAATKLASDSASDQRRVDVANEQLTLALGRVRAFASGTAQLSAAQSRAQVAEHISKAVGQIVNDVLDNSGLTETCVLLLANRGTIPETGKALYLQTIGLACPKPQREVVAAIEAKAASPDVVTERRQLLRLPPAPAPAPAPK